MIYVAFSASFFISEALKVVNVALQVIMGGHNVYYICRIRITVNLAVCSVNHILPRDDTMDSRDSVTVSEQEV